MKSSRNKILFITDPWSTLDHKNDSSLRIMQELELMGAPVFWCHHHDLSIEKNRLKIRCHRFSEGQVQFQSPLEKEIDFFSQVHYRVDPPVNEAYIQPLLILKSLAPKRVEFVNPIEALLLRGEKLLSLENPKLVPPTVISSRVDTLLGAITEYREAVIKPLNTAQSRGVQVMNAANLSEDAIRTKLMHLTHAETTPLVVQKFLEKIRTGETRLWFVDAKLQAYARKVPAKDSPIIDIDRGSYLVAHSLDKGEKKVVSHIQKILRTHRIRLAAVDLIDSKLTDFNFTSPGLIVQIEKCTSFQLARTIAKKLLS